MDQRLSRRNLLQLVALGGAAVAVSGLVGCQTAAPSGGGQTLPTTAPRPAYDPTATFKVNERDVEYRKDGSKSRLAHIYQPQGAGAFPMLVDLHPGAWTSQDRNGQWSLDYALGGSGIVVVSPDFRLGGEEPYPAAMVDANYAVRWAKAHAKDFNGTSARLGLAGGSSGGQMAIVGAMRPNYPKYTTMALAEGSAIDAAVAYVIAWGPPLDPYARYLFAQEARRLDLVTAHDTYFKTTEAMIEESAQAILERGEKVVLPPILIIHGTRDENVPFAIIEKFAASYKAAGGSIQLEAFPNKNHYFLGWLGQDFNKGVQLMKEFIAKQLAA
jgi:acetyl esterase